MSQSLTSIFIDASLIHNFVLAYFLGICPFLGVSGSVSTAWRMGAAVTFVMIISSGMAFAIDAALAAAGVEFLRLISFIVVIAATVQTVEMFVKKVSPALFRTLGIFLPLITTNCAILGLVLFQSSREYGFLQSLAFAAGAGAGFTIAIVLMAGIRERLDLAQVPAIAHGTVLSLVVAGILSLTFSGFSGLGG